MARQVVDRTALVADFATARLEQRRYSPKHRGLSRTVGPDKGDNVSLMNLQGDAAQGRNDAVIDDQFIDFEQDRFRHGRIRRTQDFPPASDSREPPASGST